MIIEIRETYSCEIKCGKCTQQTIVLMKMSWRRLEDVFRLHLQKTSSRSLQDVLIRMNMFALALRLQKTTWRGLQGVLVKTNIFVLAIRLQDVIKTFWRRLQDVLQWYFKDVFKAYHEVKLFLLTRFWEVFNTFLTRSFPKTVIYRGIRLGNTTSAKFMVSVQNLQER